MSMHHNRFKSFAGGSGVALLSALLLTGAPASGWAQETSSRVPETKDAFARVVPATFEEAQKCKGGQLGGIPSPFPLHLRLGVMLSPRTKFDGGIDASLGRGILPNFNTRIDAEAIVSANFHGISTLVPITLDQIYSKGLFGGNRIYIGGGIGPYISEKTRFGGKLFIGADLAVRVGVEGAVHFSGSGDPLLTLQARLGL